ncbi:hypothetical protein DSM112329_00309 [Paraconexibacter sp. AEG42_29]|uniref:Leucine-binding protein domain-containing protein n=1 Tax=Paraconexibacter sp. AEG42_29 TaxID=2997339 RepID=A0AAU7APG3_9ACTN
MTLSIRSGGVLAATLAATLAVGACGKSDSDSSSGSGAGTTSTAAGNTDPASVKTGPGVTAKKITLGVMTDLSGAFAPLTSVITHGNEEYWKERNAAGGVCGRTVDLQIKDHGYDTQKAVVQYRGLAPDVAALQQLVGSPMTAAILPQLKSDRMLSIPASWPSELLDDDIIILSGATYELEQINGLGHLMDEGEIKSGDKIGALYFEGDYGEAGLKGVKYFAEQNDMTVVEQKIQPTDEDMTGQVAAFKRAGVKVLAVTTAPTQMASLAGIAAAQGLDVPFLGNNPTFDPAVLKSPAAKAIIANGYFMGPVPPISSSNAKVQKSIKSYKKAFPKDTPKNAALVGFAEGKIMYTVLDKACENGDLSRDGIVKAARQLSAVSTSGLAAGDLDFSQLGEPPTRGAFIARAANIEGGLKQVGGVLESDLAKEYEG